MTLADLSRIGALVFTACCLIVLGDTAGKALTGAGVAPVFVAWTRFAVAALVFLPFSGLALHELRILTHPRVLMRGLFVTGGISSILTALQTEPIANVFGAFFIGPIASTVLAVIFLRERPSLLRVALLILGFVGVMLVVKPGFGATPGIGFAVLAGVFYGAFLATTRAIAGLYRPRLLLLSQLLVGALVLSPFGIATAAPSAMTASLWGLIGLSALGSAAGNYLIVQANRQADASLIAPLIYSQLIAATISGVLVFGDWPDALALMGLVTILVSGLGSLWLVRGR
ncbi:DMT family transporter [Roseovarius faecimaris]|uniref:DMT family transporter n=1 Tax=Roseovarius faecimaris TaxID=2494550 RepID=A0A6I6IR16_9RHOB|nr:DMT family transporter [Roseovarius faecimaris]QGX98331.1 DMT family transporter [Roseovarius faecimaris]